MDDILQILKTEKNSFEDNFTLIRSGINSNTSQINNFELCNYDMKEKVSKLWTLFTGDDEDIKKAFYGRGVLTGLPFIGAPVVSDALALGNIFNFIDMDNETMEKMLIGYEDYSLKSDDKKIYDIIRTLNVQLGRGWYRTLPMIMSGRFGAAAQYELGLYPTKYSKELKEKTGQVAKDILPPDIMEALAALESHRAAAMSKGKPSHFSPSGKQTQASYFTPPKKGKGYFDR